MWRGCSTTHPPSSLPPSYPLHPHSRQPASQPLSPDPLAHFTARVPSFSFLRILFILLYTFRIHRRQTASARMSWAWRPRRKVRQAPYALRGVRVVRSGSWGSAGQALSLSRLCAAALRFLPSPSAMPHTTRCASQGEAAVSLC